MSLGPSISLFGDKHSLSYWLFFFASIGGVLAVSHYRRTHGLAKKFDFKLMAALLLLLLGLIALWKYLDRKSVV